jgi:hypothetical protein
MAGWGEMKREDKGQVGEGEGKVRGDRTGRREEGEERGQGAD